METKLYVGNLAYSTTEEDLQSLFAQAGTVKSVALIKDRETGRSKGFGYVEMETQAETEKAISLFHGSMMNDRALTVNIARPREERPRGAGGGGRFDRGGGGGGGNRGGSGGRGIRALLRSADDLHRRLAVRLSERRGPQPGRLRRRLRHQRERDDLIGLVRLPCRRPNPAPPDRPHRSPGAADRQRDRAALAAMTRRSG